MYIYSFEKLSVWVEAKDLAKVIYKLSKKFPSDEKYGISSQLKRASISICSNVAEGSARNTGKDKAHFTTMAFSSAVEVLNQLIICYELNFISETEYINTRKAIESITNKLNALRKHQINN